MVRYVLLRPLRQELEIQLEQFKEASSKPAQLKAFTYIPFPVFLDNEHCIWCIKQLFGGSPRGFLLRPFTILLRVHPVLPERPCEAHKHHLLTIFAVVVVTVSSGRMQDTCALDDATIRTKNQQHQAKNVPLPVRKGHSTFCEALTEDITVPGKRIKLFAKHF
jgi:hypothetical protein